MTGYDFDNSSVSFLKQKYLNCFEKEVVRIISSNWSNFLKYNLVTSMLKRGKDQGSKYSGIGNFQKNVMLDFTLFALYLLDRPQICLEQLCGPL